jgi:glycosyltransferase involved in cell wall biosynthesis
LIQQVTAPSLFIMATHQKMGFFPSAKSAILPNTHGLDTAELEMNRADYFASGKKNQARRFLYLGRLVAPKGIEELCQAFIRFAGDRPDVILRVAGWGTLETPLREKYRAQRNIEFTGPVFGAQKTKLFAESDILVVPSLIPEPFGIVVAEAYAHGLPVIASRTGGLPEIVREGETGFLVDPGSLEDLQTAMQKVYENSGCMDTMSGNCFEEAKKYTLSKMADGYLGLYGEKSW